MINHGKHKFWGQPGMHYHQVCLPAQRWAAVCMWTGFALCGMWTGFVLCGMLTGFVLCGMWLQGMQAGENTLNAGQVICANGLQGA